MKRVPTLVWGTVRTNGEKFYLLEARPEHSDVWMPEGTVKWTVCSTDYKLARSGTVDKGLENDYVPVYVASHLIFGKDACVELLDDPQTEILVDYFSSEDDDNENVA